MKNVTCGKCQNYKHGFCTILNKYVEKKHMPICAYTGVDAFIPKKKKEIKIEEDHSPEDYLYNAIKSKVIPGDKTKVVCEITIRLSDKNDITTSSQCVPEFESKYSKLVVLGIMELAKNQIAKSTF